MDNWSDKQKIPFSARKINFEVRKVLETTKANNNEKIAN